MSVAHTENIVVVGAGISGLASAYRLKQLGVSSLLLEAKAKPGGLISTVRRDGCLFESGPQCPRFPASVWDLVKALGLQSEFLAGDPQAKRYILRHGRLHRAPFSAASFLSSGLVGAVAKLRVLADPLGSTTPPATEETLAQFVQRKFGLELLENLVDPVVSTVFFGDPRKMGMQSAFPDLVRWERDQGSLVRGAIRARRSKQEKGSSSLSVTEALPALGSFYSGMARLPERLAEDLKDNVRFGIEICSLSGQQISGSEPHAAWRIGLSNGETIFAKHLVLAVPACVAARLLQNSAPVLASSLAAIEYAPMSLVSSVYSRSSVRHSLDGFGYMVPRREGLHTICTFWNSTLFPGRAPRDKVLLTTFARSLPGAHPNRAERELGDAVEDETARILGIAAKSLDRELWSDPRALPQYNVGHAALVAEISRSLRVLPNLYLTGNYLKGRSIGDCVDNAFAVAAEVHNRLCAPVIERLERNS
ncbi:MAG TPA: protoporphyrinogen oxidase [Candidatus Eisenbacteria bacterium]|nr:protoporphyrinogen oxidase [Candidatus Eisenbacteria bacterium]